jgi:hypothetical protein
VKIKGAFNKKCLQNGVKPFLARRHSNFCAANWLTAIILVHLLFQKTSFSKYGRKTNQAFSAFLQGFYTGTKPT